jgi:hypothetical protein
VVQGHAGPRDARGIVPDPPPSQLGASAWTGRPKPKRKLRVGISPSECIGTQKRKVTGNPDPKHVSTSYVERQKLTMRMAIRRFTRLTNAFSKKVENHAHSVAIHFMHYNFVRIHQSLRVTPAMAAGVSKTLWSLVDMVRVIEEWEIALKEQKSAV